MGTTSNRSYPYPAGSDGVDVPGDLQALADAVDTDVAAVIAGTGLADGSVTDAKLAVPKVDQSVVGNLLTAAQAQITGGWTSLTNLTAAYASDEITLTVTSTFGQADAGNIAVTPGNPVTFSVEIVSIPEERNWRLGVAFYTAANAFVSSFDASTDYTTGATGRRWVTTTVPATAAFARPLIVARSNGANPQVNDTAVFTKATFHQGAGGLWAPPGTPIANLGIRANPADATQAQVWNPGNNTWITV